MSEPPSGEHCVTRVRSSRPWHTDASSPETAAGRLNTWMSEAAIRPERPTMGHRRHGLPAAPLSPHGDQPACPHCDNYSRHDDRCPNVTRGIDPRDQPQQTGVQKEGHTDKARAPVDPSHAQDVARDDASLQAEAPGQGRDRLSHRPPSGTHRRTSRGRKGAAPAPRRSAYRSVAGLGRPPLRQASIVAPSCAERPRPAMHVNSQ